MIGGRDYGESQFNHAVARRQPGSVFKPFVYAAAFDNAVDGIQPMVTPPPPLADEPTMFQFDGKNTHRTITARRFTGKVTVARRTNNSLNVATVKVAEMVGYRRVVQIARQMGLDPQFGPTPAVALGAYETDASRMWPPRTPRSRPMGARAEPLLCPRVVEANGNVLEKNSPQPAGARSPRGVPGGPVYGRRGRPRHRRASPGEGFHGGPRRERPARRETDGLPDSPRICVRDVDRL